jgi:hypothetical protein
VREFEALEDNHRHRTLGITVMIFGWLQPLNALIRPHPAKEGEKKAPLRLGWEILHKGVGYLAILLAVVEIFFGLDVAETFEPFSEAHSSWRGAYIGILAAVLGIWISLLVAHFRRKRCQEKKMEMDAEEAYVAKPDPSA